MGRAFRLLDRLAGALAGLALAGCFAVVSVETGRRALLGQSSLWSEELSRYLIIVSVFLGAAAAVGAREHVRVELLLDRLRPGPRRAAEVAIALACASYCLVLGVVGARWVADTAALGLVSAESDLDVPIWAFQAAIPVGFGLMALRFLTQAVDAARGDLPASDPETLPNH